MTTVICNDPYFPDPVSTDTENKEIWRVLRSAYLLTAKDSSSDLVHKYRGQVKKGTTGMCARRRQ
jgi:tRNA1(Val) A37 N6-methylase TrmN6